MKVIESSGGEKIHSLSKRSPKGGPSYDKTNNHPGRIFTPENLSRTNERFLSWKKQTKKTDVWEEFIEARDERKLRRALGKSGGGRASCGQKNKPGIEKGGCRKDEEALSTGASEECNLTPL